MWTRISGRATTLGKRPPTHKERSEPRARKRGEEEEMVGLEKEQVDPTLHLLQNLALSLHDRVIRNERRRGLREKTYGVHEKRFGAVSNRNTPGLQLSRGRTMSICLPPSIYAHRLDAAFLRALFMLTFLPSRRSRLRIVSTTVLLYKGYVFCRVFWQRFG